MKSLRWTSPWLGAVGLLVMACGPLLAGCEDILTGGTGGAGGLGSTSKASATSSGKTGAGGSSAVSCVVPSECPPTGDPCLSAVCVANLCGTIDLPKGTVVAPDVPADCQDVACDGRGHAGARAPDDANVPLPANPCVAGSCDHGTPGTKNVAMGTACAAMGGTLCDGQGACVACLADADCTMAPATTCSKLHTCVAATCLDHVKDGQETDVDCGGGPPMACPPCATGKACALDGDCVDGVCDATHACAAATCTDGRKNGSETDVDCGGNCPGCGPSQVCKVGPDCKSGLCGGGTCTPTCSDGVKDGQETDIDCGGGTCGACGTGKRCLAAADCASQACDPASQRCDANQCHDGVKDGAESDVDCGGPTCPPCGLGKGCLADADCVSLGCDAAAKTCDLNQCHDGLKNGAESDVDCGGNACPTCALGKACLADSDCASLGCDVMTKACDANQCHDGLKNGAESDVDCGGGACPACGTGKACLADADCSSLGCDLATRTCDQNQCHDGLKNGSETDVDCGGGTCPGCVVGKTCALSTDCASMTCDAPTKTCTAPQCHDGLKNGSETDVDCGGAVCAPCALGKACLADADCASQGCDVGAKKCDPNQCNDGLKDAAETDVDCGGGTCAACGLGKGCLADADCASQGCDVGTKKCDANQCHDGLKNGGETDVDCGGPCPGCLVGKQCLADGDCASQGCDVASKTCDQNQCHDGLKDGAETDVDCGGGVCPTCPNGGACLSGADCASNACDAATHTCNGNPCGDGQKDGAETDVDCGGGVCAACAVGKGCLVDADCVSQGCDVGTKKCDPNQCNDGLQNGAETDIDCGGGACAPCALGKKCALASDCQGNAACDPAMKVCAGAMGPCYNGTKDGMETDVDCGGATCDALGRTCGEGKACAADADCTVGGCFVGNNTCRANQLATGAKYGRVLTVDANNVYWTSAHPQNPGFVRKVSLNGGPVTILASGLKNPEGIAVDATTVYFTNAGNGGSINSVPIAGGAVTTIATNQPTPFGLTLDATHIYWGNFGDGTIRKSLPNGAGATILATGGTRIREVIVDATTVYWVDGGVDTMLNGTINKVPIAGGAKTILASGLDNPSGIATDGTFVYWANTGDLAQGQGAGGALYRCAIAGCNNTPTKVAPQVGKYPARVAVLGPSLYWTNTGDFTVNKTPLAGGPITQLASTQQTPLSLVVDATWVYWVNNNSGAIERAPN